MLLSWEAKLRHKVMLIAHLSLKTQIVPSYLNSKKEEKGKKSSKVKLKGQVSPNFIKRNLQKLELCV